MNRKAAKASSWWLWASTGFRLLAEVIIGCRQRWPLVSKHYSRCPQTDKSRSWLASMMSPKGQHTIGFRKHIISVSIRVLIIQDLLSSLIRCPTRNWLMFFLLIEWIPGHACQITVSRVPMSGESLAKWYDIWAASVDIVARCVRIGLSGSYEGLGM